MEISSLPIFQIFGSASSLDLDVCFFVERIGSISESKALLKKYEQQIQYITKKEVNGNLAVLKNGTLISCYKGTKDELNNALYHTYDLHQQYHNRQIQQLVARDVELKMHRCFRTIVSYFTRTPYRSDAKLALRSDLKQKLIFLSSITLADIDNFGKHGSTIEIYKSMAFQIGQTTGLLDGKELYTKETISENYSELKGYLNRLTLDPEALQACLNNLLFKSKNYLTNAK